MRMKNLISNELVDSVTAEYTITKESIKSMNSSVLLFTILLSTAFFDLIFAVGHVCISG
jgi:hypothetical protein